MKIKFKKQSFQTAAVESVADCFLGQPRVSGVGYRIDPGRQGGAQPLLEAIDELEGFRNADIALSPAELLKNVAAVQRRQNLPESAALVTAKNCPLNLDIEMETGTGKTYCYIKTMFELHQRYGWSKFVIVTPSIAIREGVKKTFEITAEHFLEEYGKRARFFIYNSKQLHNLESFSSDGGLNAMIINVQAFNATGKDARRIYEELDDFQSRRPIDVIKSNRPILILDEPQKMEGKKTVDSLGEFKPLFILRYSATHKTEFNKVHRLDALDAFQQKLVKKIAVRGVSVRGLTGTNAYLYLDSIQISRERPPIAKMEIEMKVAGGVKRVVRNVGKGDNLFEMSSGLDQYKGYAVADIDARDGGRIVFANGVEVIAGQATGDVSEMALRRIQIREAIKAHFEKEQALFRQGVKVLTLFFIDEVAKYRRYDESGPLPGEYAEIFEAEYCRLLQETLTVFGDDYDQYLKGIPVEKTHNGYFSIDKKTSRMVDPAAKKTGETKGETDDVDAYDLILKDKESLLEFPKPDDNEQARAKKQVRFIFSHSALREGWDNPNVFVICTLKHSDNTISRRQEVGRGMRLSVNQQGERMDNPATVHQINVLTVVASESYQQFVSGLQKDISESLSARPRFANKEYFTGKLLRNEEGDTTVTPPMATQIYRYLVQNNYTDDTDRITPAYREAREENKRPPLPAELAPYQEAIFKLIDSVFDPSQLPDIDDDRKKRANDLNDNFHKKEFQELWSRINHKAAYTVHFSTPELVRKCIVALDRELKVSPLQYTVQRGEQAEETTAESLAKGESFKLTATASERLGGSSHSAVKYDLLGKLAEVSKLTRRTIAEILQGVAQSTFDLYSVNPEQFLMEAGRLINEQKATVIVEHLTYDLTQERHDIDIFTRDKAKENFDKAVKTNRHIYDYVFCDAKNERDFVTELDTGAAVSVYAKLPRSFSIPTPVGEYNPDWAIAFQEGQVKHVYFIAETKGSMSSMQLRKIEETKIDCARKFFARIGSARVKYDVIDSYAKLIDLVS